MQDHRHEERKLGVLKTLMNTFHMILIVITYAVVATTVIASVALTYKRMHRELTLSKRWAPTILLLNTLIVQSERSDMSMLAKLLLTELDHENCPPVYKEEIEEFKKENGLENFTRKEEVKA